MGDHMHLPAAADRLKPGMGERGEVLLAPGAPGEIILLHLDGSTSWSIQKVAWRLQRSHPQCICQLPFVCTGAPPMGRKSVCSLQGGFLACDQTIQIGVRAWACEHPVAQRSLAVDIMHSKASCLVHT